MGEDGRGREEGGDGWKLECWKFDGRKKMVLGRYLNICWMGRGKIYVQQQFARQVGERAPLALLFPVPFYGSFGSGAHRNCDASRMGW